MGEREACSLVCRQVGASGEKGKGRGGARLSEQVSRENGDRTWAGRGTEGERRFAKADKLQKQASKPHCKPHTL